MYHIPVMIREVIQFLSPQKNGNYIDCTLGLGGHAKEILVKNRPKGMLLAIDQDPESLHAAKKNLQKFKDRTIFVCDNFRNLNKIIRNVGFQRISGILFDLGLARGQIKNCKKGISFLIDVPLDMRLDPKLTMTAADIINEYPEKQLANLFYEYGDITRSRSLAKKIIFYRKKKPIKTTHELVKIIGTKNPKLLAPVFQALRIEVNHELENLHTVLPQAVESLEHGGRIVVISYHSGEDRIVKNFFRANKGILKILTKKPIMPDNNQIKSNPSSRSAKLRAAEKI